MQLGDWGRGGRSKFNGVKMGLVLVVGGGDDDNNYGGGGVSEILFLNVSETSVSCSRLYFSFSVLPVKQPVS
jgi:hypothetical protein